MPQTIHRLDLVLISRHPSLSRRKAREVIEKGQVCVDGQTVREPGLSVESDAEVIWDPNRRAERRARISLPLLHQDEALLVIDKPAGLLSVPTVDAGESEDSALGRVQAYMRYLRPHRPYVAAVHRIDRDTSGALAFALKPAIRTSLRGLFRTHRIERCYAAIVSGVPPLEAGEIDLPIRDRYSEGRRGVARPGEPARPALTRWTVRERLHGATLLEVRLETGRQHQIRAHLAAIGHPVLGDHKYQTGRERVHAAVPRLMLHAQILAFVHPETGAPLKVRSPLPADFEGVLRVLRQERGRGRPSRR
jgi:23S rRNA pseudouridine1911/1915/1917 synthase